MDAISQLKISFATNEDRHKIYRIRHEVYASELMQHPQNEGKIFQDIRICFIVRSFGNESKFCNDFLVQ